MGKLVKFTETMERKLLTKEQHTFIHKDVSKQYYAYDIFNELISEFYERKSDIKVAVNDYPFIPYDCRSAHIALLTSRLILESVHKEPLRIFHDLGSGIGNILFLAKYYLGLTNYQLKGVEKYERNRVIIKPDLQSDIIDIPEGYLQSNSIIYLFNPIFDDRRMQRALNHIVTVAAPKSVIAFARSGQASLDRIPKKLYPRIIMHSEVDFHSQYAYIK